MRKVSIVTLAILTALLVAAPSRAPEANADDYGAIQRLLDGESAVAAVTAVNKYTPIVVKWVGASGGGTVTVAAGGDITLSTGAVGASAVDTTLECPVSGALGGIIDVSDAACDTLGEVCNYLNASPNWRCVLRDGLASDSSDNTLAALSETAANGADGLALYGDSAVTFDVAAEITPERSILRELDTGTHNILRPNVSANSRVALFEILATSTYASGTSTIEVFSCKTQYPKRWGAYADGDGALENLSETCTTLDSRASAATTVEKDVTYPYALESKKNERMVVKLNNSAAMSAATLYAYGRVAYLR